MGAVSEETTSRSAYWYFWFMLIHMGEVLKTGQGKFCGRKPLKNLKGYGLLNGCLRQDILSLLLNTLPHIVWSTFLVQGSRKGDGDDLFSNNYFFIAIAVFAVTLSLWRSDVTKFING